MNFRYRVLDKYRELVMITVNGERHEISSLHYTADQKPKTYYTIFEPDSEDIIEHFEMVTADKAGRVLTEIRQRQRKQLTLTDIEYTYLIRALEQEQHALELHESGIDQREAFK